VSLTTRYRRVLTLQVLEVVGVVIAIMASYVVTGAVVYGDHLPIFVNRGLLGAGSASFLSLVLFGPLRYFTVRERPTVERLAQIVGVVLFSELTFVAYMYFTQNTRFEIVAFFMAAGLQIVLLMAVKLLVTARKNRILASYPAAVIGPADEAPELLQRVRAAGAKDLRFLAYDQPSFGDDLKAVEVVYVAVDAPFDVKRHVVAESVRYNQDVFLVPETYEISMHRSSVSQIGDVPVFALERYRLGAFDRIVKRAFDLVLGLIGLIVSAPITLLVAAAIKLDDGGPVFYRQVRVGRRGRPFQIVKFRTMKTDAEDATGPVFAQRNDPRTTRIGKFLRSTRLDELPQLLNVVHGTMSLVGPRPERPEFVEQFQQQIDEFHIRTLVKPGLTGLAQVMGRYTTPPEDKLRFDMIYIQEYSVPLDLKIMLLTFRVLLAKAKADGFEPDADDRG